VSERDYAEWVRPIAEVLFADSAEVIAFARSHPAEGWDEPSGADGWTRRDVLAHLAGGNDQMVQIILRRVTARQPLDGVSMDPDTDAENAAGVQDRQGWGIERLIAELVADDEEMQQLFAKLTEDDEDLELNAMSMTLGQFLRLVGAERHDAEHLQQMKR